MEKPSKYVADIFITIFTHTMRCNIYGISFWAKLMDVIVFQYTVTVDGVADKVFLRTEGEVNNEKFTVATFAKDCGLVSVSTQLVDFATFFRGT